MADQPIALVKTVKIPNREAKLFCTLMANNRRKPNVDKRLVNKQILACFERAYEVDDIEDTLIAAEQDSQEAKDFMKGEVEVSIPTNLVEQIEAFIHQKCGEKDKEGEGILNDLYAKRLLNMLSRLK